MTDDKRTTCPTHDPLACIAADDLATVNGGNWDDFKNLLKGAVNGGTNALNLLHDHPVELGKLGTFQIGGQRLQKPFTNDPLSRIGLRDGRPVPAK